MSQSDRPVGHDPYAPKRMPWQGETSDADADVFADTPAQTTMRRPPLVAPAPSAPPAVTSARRLREMALIAVITLISAGAGVVIYNFASYRLMNDRQPGHEMAAIAPRYAPAPSPAMTRPAPLPPEEPATAPSFPAPSVVAAPEAAPSMASTASTVRGVTPTEIKLGITSSFSGANRENGRQMKLGLDTAFGVVNAAGGIHGRQLRLVAVDDGYEPARAVDGFKQLIDKDAVFGTIGNGGTPTSTAVLPLALQQKVLFFGAYTGAPVLRRDPPDRYVFNFRASYAEETEAVVQHLVKVRRLRPKQIAVLAQQDGFGDAGFQGVVRAMRTLGADPSRILRLNYRSNTADVDQAVAQFRARKAPQLPIKAVVMVATYRPAAKFIEKTREAFPGLLYTNVSAVNSSAFADELTLLGPQYADGVIVTQVVPGIDGASSFVLEYQKALAQQAPGEAPSYVSLEGYVNGMLLAEGLRRAGPQLDTERLVDALETIRNFDPGLGTPLTFSRTEHQASHKVWGTKLDRAGHAQPYDLQ